MGEREKRERERERKYRSDNWSQRKCSQRTVTDKRFFSLFTLFSKFVRAISLPIRWMAEEELPLACQSSLDVLSPLDIFLRTIDNTDVPWSRFNHTRTEMMVRSAKKAEYSEKMTERLCMGKGV